MPTSAKGSVAEATAIPTFPASTFEPERFRFAWKNRIPAATLTVVAGPPGFGKSTVSGLIAADVTQKGNNVIISNHEDDIAPVIRPRLEAAGANLDKTHLIPLGETLLLPADFDRLEALLDAIRPKIFFMDPFASHFEPQRHVHSPRTLAKLMELARKYDCAFVGIHHTTKGNLTGTAIGLIGGPQHGLSGRARAVYLFGADPSDEDRRALACVKINGASTPPTLILDYSVCEIASGSDVEADRLNIVKTSGATALEVSRPPKKDKRRDEACAEFLTKFLTKNEDGRQPSLVVLEAGTAAGFSMATLERVRLTLQIDKKRVGGWGTHGKWYWVMPSNHPLMQRAAA